MTFCSSLWRPGSPRSDKVLLLFWVIQGQRKGTHPCCLIPSRDNGTCLWEWSLHNQSIHASLKVPISGTIRAAVKSQHEFGGSHSRGSGRNEDDVISHSKQCSYACYYSQERKRSSEAAAPGFHWWSHHAWCNKLHFCLFKFSCVQCDSSSPHVLESWRVIDFMCSERS